MEGLGGSHMGLGVRLAGQVQGKFLNLCTVAPFPPVSVCPSFPFPFFLFFSKVSGSDSSNAGGLNLYLTKHSSLWNHLLRSPQNLGERRTLRSPITLAAERRHHNQLQSDPVAQLGSGGCC